MCAGNGHSGQALPLLQSTAFLPLPQLRWLAACLASVPFERSTNCIWSKAVFHQMITLPDSPWSWGSPGIQTDATVQGILQNRPVTRPSFLLGVPDMVAGVPAGREEICNWLEPKVEGPGSLLII